MAYPAPIPPLNTEETREFLDRLDNFKLNSEQKELYKDSVSFYKHLSKKKSE